MLDFIWWHRFEKIDWFLDSEDKVNKARIELEESTKELFEKYKLAKMKSYHDAINIILD